MPYYAANNVVSTDPIEGGIKISKAQYLAAIDAMVAGKAVTIEGGFDLVDPTPSEEAAQVEEASQ